MISRAKDRHRYRSIFYKKRNERRKKQSKNGERGNCCRKILFFPKNINIHQSRDDILMLFNTINSLSNRKNITIYLDFSKTKDISAIGMLIIFSALCNLSNINKKIKFYCKTEMINRVKQVLKKIGILKLCKQNTKVKITRSDVKDWSVCSGNTVIQENFDELVKKRISSLLPKDTDIYAGCIEATANAVNHAYVYEKKDVKVAFSQEAWWSFSQVKDGALSVIVCDLGLTIPGTLPFRWPQLCARIKNIFGDINDAELIYGAIKESSSRTGENYRGNGLKKIAEIASLTKGNLDVFSRNGYVHFDANCEPVKRNFRTPLNGTVIAWTLPLEAKG